MRTVTLSDDEFFSLQALLENMAAGYEGTSLIFRDASRLLKVVARAQIGGAQGPRLLAPPLDVVNERIASWGLETSQDERDRIARVNLANGGAWTNVEPRDAS